MAEKENHQLVEVLCGFWFDPNKNPWDSTYFGKYYEEIEKLGFTKKEEQQGFKIKFELKPSETEQASASTDKLEPRMLFRNESDNKAILMASNYISFHKLPPYENWESLVENQIKPGLETYNQLGLGSGLLQIQMLYLNRYELDETDKLSNYFNFVPCVEDFGIGKERNLLFQSQYELDPNLLVQIKIISNPVQGNKKEVFLECSCIAFNTSGNTDWMKVAALAHDTNNKVFNSISKLKN